MRKNFIDRLLLPTIVALLTVLAALIVLQRLLVEQRIEILAATKEQTFLVKAKLESELNARVLPLDSLARRWEILAAIKQPSDMVMKSDAALVMSTYRGYEAIKWVDPMFHVRWEEPRRGNEPDLGLDADARAALQRARDSGRIVVARPASLQEGGRALFVCAPIFVENKLSGFLLGIIRSQELFSSILQDLERSYRVALYDGDQEIYSSPGSGPARAEAWAQETNIGFRQLIWRTRIWPKMETLEKVQSSLPKAVFLGGILMAGLLALATYMGETAQLNANELAATNKELEKEIAVREQAEEALRHAQKMEAVGRLAGGVAHDFNNLLMVIRGQASLSLNSFDLNNPMRQKMNEILKATDRASSMTRQLLAFSRKQNLQPKVLDLNALVTQATELLSPSLGENIDLFLDLDPNLGYIKADAAQMDQVIINLVFNARDAMPNGGKLTIQTANTQLDESWTKHYLNIQTGPHVVLTVRDSGCGMDEETQSHIFEPFFTTKEIGKGTGLGLATVYGTVNQTGGCVTISSKLGEGTIIQIYLPRAEKAVEVAEKSKALPGSLEGHETVLVVEDDDAVRRMTIEFLKIKDYTVVDARSPAEAIQFMKCHNGSIDLVLTDVSMPGMSGRELVEQLVKLRSGLKILYMSAYTEDVAINSGALDSESAFIEKPFSPDELACKVREILGTTMGRERAKYAHYGQ
jgi:signal transduction histidine kinase